MAGGHLDSVTAGPGVNDNGSGVAALLELADALGGRAPGARVRLAFWGAEELGLIGSRRYVGGPGRRAARERIAAYLNLDMVGSPEPTRGVYSDTDPAIETLLRRLVGPRAEEENASGRSDHAPFQRAGIPVGGLYTGAGRPHDPCYHRACDDLGNVDMPVLVDMARAAAEAVERLSARQSRRSRTPGPAPRTAPAAARPRTSSIRPPGSPGSRSARRTAARPARSR